MVSKKRLLSIACFCLVSGYLIADCRADDRALDRSTLRGVKAVVVKVHSWASEWRAELEKAGICG